MGVAVPPGDAAANHRTRQVIEAMEFDEKIDAVVVSVRPRKGARAARGRCGGIASEGCSETSYKLRHTSGLTS